MKSLRIRALLAAFSLFATGALCWSCATVSNDEQSVRNTEAMLDDAGFAKVPVDVPSEDLEHLPAFTLNQYQSVSGKVFWYYDPDYCQCLYEGDQLAADRFQIALEHQGDLAQYQADAETEQSAAQQALIATTYSGAVPTPFFWGGWAAWYGYGLGLPRGGYAIIHTHHPAKIGKIHAPKPVRPGPRVHLGGTGHGGFGHHGGHGH